MDLSPLPILDAAERYRGEFVELDTGCVVTAAAFQAGRQQLSARLAQQGLTSGSRAVVSVGNGPQFVATLVAVLARGGCPILVHPKTPAPELRRIALRYGATWALAGECPSADIEAAGMTASTIAVNDWIRLSAARVDPATSGFDGGYADLPGVPLHPTSGTTGEPKVAVRPGRAAVEEARHYIETIDIGEADTIVAVPPMCHAYAYGMCVMVPLLSGARVVSMRNFQVSLLLQALAERRVTILPAVPAMLDVLMFGAGERLKMGIRVVLSAGSPLSERTAERFLEKSGVMVRPLYGTTETGGITVAPDGGQQTAGSCVGPAMRGVEAEVRMGPSGVDSQPGLGRVHIRSSSMMAGYFAHDGVDASPVVDGWFATGDLGRIDSDGRVHLLGRESDVINVAGLKVIPSEVEETIAALPGVMEVKVYGGVRRNGSQYVKAAVVVAPEANPTTIRKHCEANLVYYKRPEKIIAVDRLPRSPAGKILRDQLP
jgi:acyl-coenzyme A synthetase/AMP-(fatty) acid ligase